MIAGIVTFNPSLNRLKKNILAIINQVDKVLIFDNCSSIRINDFIIKHFDDRVVLIESNINYGIAYALNFISNWALQINSEWLITLDQDTIVSSNIINEYKKAIKEFKNKKVGIFCPRVLRNGENIYQIENLYEELKECITSGNLISLQAWKQIGGFDSWMFIDFVDFEYCHRLGLNGFKIIKVNSTYIDHNIGEEKQHYVLGRNFTIYNHNPYRNYFYVRNTIYYIKKHHKTLNVPGVIYRLIKWETKKILFENNRAKILVSIVKGLYDGLMAKVKTVDWS